MLVPLESILVLIVDNIQSLILKLMSRESSWKMIDAEFNAGTSVVKVNHWACSREEHQNHGFHYYQALKLTGFKKWLSVENKMVENQGVQVSFSSKHNFCLSTYRYVCKSDQNVAHSENHPPGLLQLLLQKPKSQLQYFVLSLPQIGSPQKENVLVVL